MDLGRGAPPQEFDVQGPWVPATPAKPIPTKRPLIPGHARRNQAASGSSWLESMEASPGIHGKRFSQEIFSQNGSSGSWDFVDQLQDLNGSQGAALTSHASKAHSHNVGSRPLGAGSRLAEMEGWEQMPYRDLLAITDAAAVSKITPLAPFMVAQIGAGQETSVRPNQLLLNGKVLLPIGLCNSNTQQPSQRSQYGFPVPFLPNLNSLPEIAASKGVSEALPSPPTPVTLEKNKSSMQHCPPREIIDLVDERSIDRNMEGKESDTMLSTAEKPAELFFSNSAVQSQIVSCQQQQEESGMNVFVSNKDVSHQQVEIEQHVEEQNQGIDLNKTPAQKPKRKKHRPKVIREGKAAKTPKPVTPTPKTPRPPRNSETPSGKRKYVWKNPRPPRNSETASGKRKYVRKKKDLNSLDNPSSVLGEIVDPESGSRTRTVRRSLNFDLEESQTSNGILGSAFMFTGNAESQAQEACPLGTNDSSSTNSMLPCSAPAQGLTMENSQAGTAFDLNISMNQLPNEYTVIPETATPPPRPSGWETMRVNQMEKAFTRFFENLASPPQPSRIEEKRLKKLSRKKDYTNIERSLETTQNQLDSSNISEALLQGTKRDHRLVDNARVSAYISFMHANSKTDLVHESNDTSRQSLCPEVHKKQRIETGQSGITSNASNILTYTPSNGWKMSMPEPNNSEVLNFGDAVQNNSEFTFADAQRLMALEKMQASERATEHMLVFSQFASQTNSTSLQAHSSASVSAALDCNKLSSSVKPFGEHNNTMGCNQMSPPEKPSGCHDHQEREICGGQACVEDNNVNRNVKRKTGRRKKKEQVHPVSLMSSDTSQVCLQELEAASCNGDSSLRKKSIKRTASASRNLKQKNSGLPISSIQDCQSSSNHRESAHASFLSGAMVLYGDPVDDIVQKLRRLNINSGHGDVAAQPQNALVPYSAGSMIVPYEGPFGFTKKRRPRAKVDLDPESNRVWKLLMGKESSEGDEGLDPNKEKWWEEERRVFRGRADSFIARMHLVQGDRRFSQWKGSVVDSVIGVFLTQNVSDHLSSSAFMALAARFPLQSRGSHRTTNAIKISRSIPQQDGCVISFDDNTSRQDKKLGQIFCDQSPLVIHESENIEEKETANSNESLGSNIGGSTLHYSKAKSPDFHELGIGHESPDSGSLTTATVTGGTSLAEGEDRRSVEDVVSSQNSVVSYQNSSEYQVQTDDQSKLSSSLNFEADDLLIGGMFNSLDSKSFMELLQMAENRKFQEQSAPASRKISSTEIVGDNDQMALQGVEKRSSALKQSDYLNGASAAVYTSNYHLYPAEHDLTSLSCAPSPYNYQSSPNSKLVGIENANIIREENQSNLPSTSSKTNMTHDIEIIGRHCVPLAENLTKAMNQQSLLTAETAPPSNSYASRGKHFFPQLTSSATEVCVVRHSCCQSNLPRERMEASSHLQCGHAAMFQEKEVGAKIQESTPQTVKAQDQQQNCGNPQTCLNSNNNNSDNNLRSTLEVVKAVESNFKNETHISQKVSAETPKNASKAKKVKAETEKKKTYDWDSLRKEACRNGAKKERSSDTMDSLDWEAVRCADVSEIAHTIRERGMNNMLAERIKDFLNRVVRDHASIDLEWLRDVPPDKAKDYLLSIRGLGLKSVECVRLLTLHHLAFPVDTNVGRICVRLGWVPLQPLPESLQLHLLEMYPVLETIQKYLWPRLCKLDQRTLYELHYQMITFGKVFCTKSKPNCNACPMRGECKHFASAFASARLALPGPEEKGLVSSTIPIASDKAHTPVFNTNILPQLEGNMLCHDQNISRNCEPIIEEPATPEPECIEYSEREIEDAFYEDPDEIPTIKLNLEEFTQNLHNYMQENNLELQDGDMSKALVALTPEAASIPMPKLKNVSRLRTEHLVYELPDTHPLLEGLDKREPDDPCPYLLAIWTPGETAQSVEPPQVCCNSQDTGKLCDMNTCFSCNSIREARAQTVRGTLLIPCRTAMRGSFPLNGTYFQVNEVFADHDSSRNPIDVPRDWIWNLARRTVYFGTSIPTIFKGLTTEGIQHCFWRGFVCVRGFDRTSRAPRPLYARLHFPASKVTRNKKTAAAAAAAKEDE